MIVSADEKGVEVFEDLPRKFKTGFALPPSNDVDVFTQDLGFIAIVEDGRLAGYNVTVGGGLGMSHGNAETFPRLADVLGFIPADKVNAIGEAALTTQRDCGDRTNRKHARLKYTITCRTTATCGTRLRRPARKRSFAFMLRVACPVEGRPRGAQRCGIDRAKGVCFAKRDGHNCTVRLLGGDA